MYNRQERVPTKSLRRMATTDLNREKDVSFGHASMKGNVKIRTEFISSLIRPRRRRSELISRVSFSRPHGKTALTFCYRSHKRVPDDALMKTHSDRQSRRSPSLKKVLIISRCYPSRPFACPRSNKGGGRWTGSNTARRAAGSVGSSRR